MKIGTQLWAGTDPSFQAYIENLYKCESNAGFKADMNYDSEISDTIYTVDNGVATIDISGSLVNGSAGFMVYFGAIGYYDIRNALVRAVKDPEVQAILLNFNTGGGDVAGCHECSQLISRVNAVKPVITYTGSAMCSAGLWLGSQAQFIVAAQTATVGSLGIIMVHVDRTEQLKMDGIKATVIRAGTEKALASPYEVLSTKAFDNLKSQADELYSIFLDQVAKGRGMESSAADTAFGQGREFLGKAAKRVGLVDAVGTFEDAMQKAQALCKKKKSASSSSNGFDATNTKLVQASSGPTASARVDNTLILQGNPMQALSAEQLAAIAGGVEIDPPAPAADATPAPAAAPAAVTAPAPAAAVTPPTDSITLLQGMLATAQTEILASKLEASTHKAALESLQAAQGPMLAQVEALTEVVRSSIRTMGIHFGVTKEAAASMSATEALAEHARLAGMFTAKFKVGGVAATTLSKTDATAPAPVLSASDLQAAMKLPRAN